MFGSIIWWDLSFGENVYFLSGYDNKRKNEKWCRVEIPENLKKFRVYFPRNFEFLKFLNFEMKKISNATNQILQNSKKTPEIS